MPYLGLSYKYLECRIIVAILHNNAMHDINANSIYQNQRKMKIFSFITFNAITHNASSFCILPEAPYLRINEHNY